LHLPIVNLTDYSSILARSSLATQLNSVEAAKAGMEIWLYN